MSSSFDIFFLPSSDPGQIKREKGETNFFAVLIFHDGITFSSNKLMPGKILQKNVESCNKKFDLMSN